MERQTDRNKAGKCRERQTETEAGECRDRQKQRQLNAETERNRGSKTSSLSPHPLPFCCVFWLLFWFVAFDF